MIKVTVRFRGDKNLLWSGEDMNTVMQIIGDGIANGWYLTPAQENGETIIVHMPHVLCHQVKES